MLTNNIEEKNAIIENVRIQADRDYFPTVWVDLKYAGGGQSMGGHVMFSFDITSVNDLLKKEKDNWVNAFPLMGYYITRLMQITGKFNVEDMKGAPVRVRATHYKVCAIGHYLKDDWFEPEDDIKRLRCWLQANGRMSND